ncbi:zinc-binding dehydrogenase [bacterium]|nr:zinc-binding dehydrogenase [bacterium]
MKTIQFSEHGQSSVLEVIDLDPPVLLPGQVLVEIKASALNHLDLWIRRGLPGLDIPMPHIPGSDAAGVIIDLGSDIHSWNVGDEVVIQPGTFCRNCPSCKAGREDMCSAYGIIGETEAGLQRQLVALPESNLGLKPKSLSFAEAAALSLSALTSWNMLKNRAKLQSGETVLVLGAGSGVGVMAIQIAKQLGAQVIATGGTERKRMLALEIGADEVLNHREPGFGKQVKQLTGWHGADVIIEHVGEATWDESLKALAVGGRLVTCGATTGVKGQVNLQHLFYKRQSLLGSTMGSVSDFQACIKLTEQGVLKPVIDKVFSFADVQAAHNYLEFQHDFGKVVLEGWD